MLVSTENKKTKQNKTKRSIKTLYEVNENFHSMTTYKKHFSYSLADILRI